MSKEPLLKRRMTVGALGFFGAAAMFASGVLVARATMGDDNPQPSSSGSDVAGIGRADGAGAPGWRPELAGRNGAAAPTAGDSAAAADRALPWGGCEAPLGDVFDGTAVDPASLGFDLKSPGEGFSLLSFNVRRQGQCDDTGSATGGDVVVDTRWQHDETGLTAWLSQRVEPDRTSNVMWQGNTEFWDGGYAFSVGVNPYRMLPIDPLAAEDGARDLGGDVATTDVASAPARIGGEPDPRAQGLLESIISAVAPDLGFECFYRQTESGWGDLAADGIGDPRAVIPGGYNESYTYSMKLDPPDPACGTPAPEYGQELFLDTAYTNDAGGYINISVYPLPEDGSVQAGRLEQGMLNWNNGRHQFYVSIPYGPEGQGDATALSTIARALDPGFEQRCIVRASSLSSDELASLGVATPLVPDGFRVDSTWFQRYEGSGDCSGVPGVDAGFRATWAMFSEGYAGMIELTISKGVEYYGGGEPNTATPYGYFWTDANGVHYALNGYKGQVGEDTLIAVAKSVDPTFDPSNLTSAGVGDPVPMPMPVR
ncbi:MAG: hypothetical protein M0R74_13090 [Dehalococcoidia bacterium]|nr:hypothetical protein [Dehalococcoidia bacterium]